MNKRVQAIRDSLERQGIDITRIGPCFEENVSRIHLRFDRVALRFVDDVQSSLNAIVPDGNTLMFTITAPIRLAAKTAIILAEKVRGAVAHQSARVDLKETINGNEVRVRLLKGVLNGRRLIGFVHNPDSDPEILFEATQSLLRRIA